MKEIAVYGSGGQAREMISLIEEINDLRLIFRIIGILDDNVEKHGQSVDGYVVHGGLDWAKEHPHIGYVVGIGSPPIRRKVVNLLKQAGCGVFPILVHPTAVVGSRVRLATGTVICATAVLTTNITIREHVLVNIGCTVGHDCEIGEFTTINPNASVAGNVCIAAGCELGTLSAVIPGKKIGAWSIVGAGAIVTSDLPANVIAVGVPAKVIKARSDGWHDV